MQENREADVCIVQNDKRYLAKGRGVLSFMGRSVMKMDGASIGYEFNTTGGCNNEF